ncbi:MAG: C45 family autoproteolytic acyltransferase/hydrolase [Actinomycetota bacterium]|nr:C45 family autoproteolytic acyltransferase/hydrolase [Actinomycetota bacterium]
MSELPPRIPILRVSGTHREVGRQVGEACATDIRAALDFDADIPEGRTREEQLALARSYWEVTKDALPWLAEEYEGAAEAAGVDSIAMFATAIEEIWYAPRAGAKTASMTGRCSDLVALPPATANGHVLVAHNNDLSPSAEAGVVAIEWTVPGDPVVFTIGGDLGASVGWNSAGVSFTGNELSPNDERLGVPRGPQFISMLRQPTLQAALDEGLRPDRASSYNQVLASSDGKAVNLEGSATDAEVTGPSERGTFAHTNNYVCERMLPFEGEPDYAFRSGVRYARAVELLDAADESTITEEGLRSMLSDHENAPDSICRHPELYGGETKTVFWCVADVTERRITFGRGNPCNSEPQTYAFA